MFDAGGLGGMLAGFQQQLKSVQEECASTHYSSSAGGGAVEVTVNGQNEIISIVISEDGMSDKEMLEDLIIVAVNTANQQAKADLQQRMSVLTQGLPIPPGMLNF